MFAEDFSHWLRLVDTRTRLPALVSVCINYKSLHLHNLINYWGNKQKKRLSTTYNLLIFDHQLKLSSINSMKHVSLFDVILYLDLRSLVILPMIYSSIIMNMMGILILVFISQNILGGICCELIYYIYKDSPCA